MDCIRHRVGSAVGYRSIALGFKPRSGYVRRVFHLLLRLITVGGPSARLASNIYICLNFEAALCYTCLNFEAALCYTCLNSQSALCYICLNFEAALCYICLNSEAALCYVSCIVYWYNAIACRGYYFICFSNASIL